MRSFLGIVAGIAAAFASVFVIEKVGSIVYPLPAELNYENADQVRAIFAGMPLGAHLLVVLAWFLGALVGGFVGKLVSRERWVAWVIAGLMALAGILNILLLPHPVWMQLAAVIAPLLGGLIAVHVGPRASAATPEPVVDQAS